MYNRTFGLDLWPIARNLLLLGRLVATLCSKYLEVFVYCYIFWGSALHLQIPIWLQKFVSSLSSPLPPSSLSSMMR